MYIIITVDTEEDNWSKYSTNLNTVNNIENILQLQKLFDEFGALPTYLLSYPVATNLRSVKILKDILTNKKCELGMHCHPWNTPPFEEEISIFNTMLCNLPESLVMRKLTNLHETISENFGIVPISFRSGRWGFSPAVARSLYNLGYQIDTSITPYVNWRDYQGPDFSNLGPEPFRFQVDNIMLKDANGPLLQVPASIGFLQSDFNFQQRLQKTLEKKFAKKIHISGCLERLKLHNKVWLSPELSDTDSLIKLARRMGENGFPCLNMSFHSSSLLKGLSPFVKTAEDEQNFFQKIRKFLEYVSNAGYEFKTLAQFEKLF